ncbi:HAMP domain-containing protein [Blautia faecis]|uniref:HAMP domain-containing protein n=1 Tax=Blautia faecis TaxID=871665 RepID=UPI003A7F4A53
MQSFYGATVAGLTAVGSGFGTTARADRRRDVGIPSTIQIAGCGIAVSLFYKNKLKRPIQELKMASQMIAEEDLDFHMAYENEDEMGMLCREFERMRGQLEENNRRVRAIDSSDTGTRNVILEIPAAGERHLPPVVVSDEARQQHADYQRNGFWRHW